MAGLFSEPTTDEELAKNVLLIDSLRRGQEAQAQLSDVEASGVIENAYDVLYSGDAEAAAEAAAELAGTVGVYSPDFQAFLHEWGVTDPVSASGWAWGTAQAVVQAQAAQEQAAAQAEVEQAQAKGSEIADTFLAEHPDAQERGDQITALAMAAVQAGMVDPEDLVDPERSHEVLGQLAEVARQVDPSVPGTPGWERAEHERMVQSWVRIKPEGDRGSGITEKQFLARFGHEGWAVENGKPVLREIAWDRARLEDAASRPLSQAEWEQAESDRIFRPDRERNASFRAEVRAVADAGDPGARRTSRFGAPARDSKSGKFVAAADVPAAEPGAPGEVAAAPAHTGRLTEWDAYPRQAGRTTGAWWAERAASD